MGTRREVELESGTQVELTSLRTRRKVMCTLGELVGLGGLAKVYAGYLEDDTHIVLKVQRYEGRGADRALEVEIELFKKLFHRNIVHCVGVGVTHGGHLAIGFRRAYQNPLLLMSKASVDQGMRRDKKARYPHLPLDTAIDLSYELLNSLAYLERLGFVHHDVKLANLLIDVAPSPEPYSGREILTEVVRRNYRGVLIDFGATRSRNYLEAWNRGETLEGLAPQITPFYAPPESVVEARRKSGDLALSFDPSLDVYAAALVIYAMITGHPPYSHLRQTVNPHDLESVIAVKSAERRGEIETIGLDTIRRVVLDDTKFLEGDRSSFDLALYKFLIQRLDPDPTQRGSAGDMKREFERLCHIRSARGPNPEMLLGSGSSRVFLPFQQELVQVGGKGAHPLLKAARLYGLEDGDEPHEEPETGDEPQSRMDWLDDMMMDGQEATGSGTGQVDERPSSGRYDPGVDTDPGSRRLERQPSGHGRVRPPSDPGRPSGRTPTPAPSGPRKRRRPPPPKKNPRVAPNTRGHSRSALTESALSKPGRATSRRDRSELLRQIGDAHARVNVTSTRSLPPQGKGSKNPLERGYPPLGLAESPHCLLSPVLDAPLLLSREKRYYVGRDPSVDVRIKSDLVSRRHAQIHYDGMGFVVTDLGSLNGTSLNNCRLQSPCPLHDEDMISFGGFEFVVRVLTKGEWDISEDGGTTKIYKGGEDVSRTSTPELAGSLSQLSLRDVIEMIDWKRHSGTLEIAPEGGTQGYIYFDRGKIIHSASKDADGVDSVVRLLKVRRGSYVFKHGNPPCPRTVDSTLDDLWEKSKGL